MSDAKYVWLVWGPLGGVMGQEALICVCESQAAAERAMKASKEGTSPKYEDRFRIDRWWVNR